MAMAGVGLRAFLGPTHILGVSLNSPLGCETCLAVCLLIVGWLQTVHNKVFAIRVPQHTLLLTIGLVVAISLVFTGNLNAPFLSDDYILINIPVRPGIWFTSAGGDGSFRPIGSLYFALMELCAGHDPWKWHLVSLTVHVANCLLLFALALELWKSEKLAFLAALTFGIHGTRAETVTWTAASFDLLATFFVLLSAVLYFSKIAKPIRWTLALALVPVAVLCKESAYAYPFMLLCLAYAAGRIDKDVVVFVALALAVCAALFFYRWILFHGPGGYIDPVTGRLQILSLQPLSTAKALLGRIWAILFFPINWVSPMNVWTRIGILGGCFGFLLLFLHARLARTTVVGLALSVVAGCIPVVPLALIGDSALGSRLLYLPAVGFCLLIGFLAHDLRSRPVFCGTAAFLIFSLAVTLHNAWTWRSVALAADRECTIAAALPDKRVRPPATLEGVYFFSNGFQECVDMQRRRRDR